MDDKDDHVVAEDLGDEALRLYVASGLRMLGWYLGKYAAFDKWLAEQDQREATT